MPLYLVTVEVTAAVEANSATDAIREVTSIMMVPPNGKCTVQQIRAIRAPQDDTGTSPVTGPCEPAR